MSRYSDFANKKSATKHFFIQLSLKTEPNFSMLTSPKNNYKVAGEGIGFI